MNQAAVEKLPLVLVVANNQYAYSTPTSRQFACDDLADKAVGYGVDGHTVDGDRFDRVLESCRRCRGPGAQRRGAAIGRRQLLRLCGHGEHDDADYIDPELKNSPLGRDCLKVAEEYLLQQNWTEPAQLAVWRSEYRPGNRGSRRASSTRTRAGSICRGMARTRLGTFE